MVVRPDRARASAWSGSTAYLDEAEGCDRVLLLDRGKAAVRRAPDGHDRVASTAACSASRGAGERRRRAAGRSARRDPRSSTASSRARPSGWSLPSRKPPAAPSTRPLATPIAGRPVAAALRGRLRRHAGRRPGRALAARRGSRRSAAKRRPPAIEADGLTKRFGDFTAADDITFTIQRGEIFGLLGPNGAGKSTTFKMLCGLLAAERGRRLGSPGFDLRRDAGRGARPARLHGAEVLALRRSERRARTSTSSPASTASPASDARARSTRWSTIFELGRQLAGRSPDAAARLQAAAGAGLRRDARARRCCSSTSRPRASIRLTRREFWTHINALVEQRRDGAGHHPFHGRGRVLRPDRADLPRQDDRPGSPDDLQAPGQDRGTTRSDAGGRFHRTD